MVTAADGVAELSFDAKLAALTAQAAGETTFTADGQDYELDADGNIIQSGSEVATSAALLFPLPMPAWSSAVTSATAWKKH